MLAPLETPPPPVVKQPLWARIFWFGVGGGLSTGLNAGAFELGRRMLWSDAVSYAVSLSLVTVMFTLWNYYINFKTDRSLRESTARYLGCVAICGAINYGIALSGIKAWGQHDWMMRVLIIGCVQVPMGGVKFLLYHFWVYPRARH